MHKMAIVMGALDAVVPQKSTDFALMLAAQERGWSVFYLPPEGICWQEGELLGYADWMNDWWIGQRYPVAP